MIGQGRPNTSPRQLLSFVRGTICRRCRLALAIVLAFSLHVVTAGEETVRIRVDWGGHTDELWQGVIALSEGTLSEPRPLGIEADEPGSMWLDRGPVFPVAADGRPAGPEMDHLVIRQRSPRTYDGVDLLVTAPLEAKLLIALSKAHREEKPARITIPLANLVSESHVARLDDQGNRLLVRRAPGDRLRVRLKHDSLIFSPGEPLGVEVEPNLLAGEPGSEVRIKIQLVGARTSDELWSTEWPAVAGQHTPVYQEVPLPDREGVYDLLITATRGGRGLWTPPVPIPGRQPLAVRRVQVLVLSPYPPVASRDHDGNPSRLVEEIDPAKKWWERFAKLPDVWQLSRLWKGPLGNGNSRTLTHPLGQLVQLGPSPNPDDVAWEAYTLPISRPGQPHILEIDYPSDVPQTMGISIIEPDPAGAVFPIGLDSGVELAEEVAGRVRPAKWLQHRLIFWPRTKSPVVLITNRRDGSPAVYGKIRVLAVGEHLPPLAARGTEPGRVASRADVPSVAKRLVAAYLDRPLFPENFSAAQSLASSSELGVDDWVTFHQGGTRLVEYLNHVGFGGLMIAVLADGSTIYPSSMLQPTPCYDTGVFQEAGQDLVRKDVLEMLFRLFDRQRLELIPAMEFAAPLPELEAELRRGGPESEGIRWVGPEGKTWLETYRPARGIAPYYNVLHPRVQEAMLAAIREVVERYGHHPSFAGLAIQLSAHGYAQLPGPYWGMDDTTIARFEQDAQVRVPGEGPGRFAERARVLAAEHPRKWMAWRARQLSRFYGRVQAELTAGCPNARLYLAGANMLTGEELERELRPVLPREMTITEAMLRVGIDIRHYGDDQPAVLLRPERFAPAWSLARQAVDMEIRQMLEVRQMPHMRPPFGDLAIPGSLFFHQPQELRLASFDEKCPFKPSYTWLASQPVPSQHQNRRRFVHSLATLDSQVMFDGGWQLLLGQEDSIREMVAAYRQLPAVRFRRLSDQYGSDPAQPVTIRYASHAGATYVYLVNDAPFATVARVEVDCPIGCQLEELGGLRSVPPLMRDAGGAYWTVGLEPYDLVAVRFSDPRVTVARPQVSWSEQVQKELELRIADLEGRTAVLGKPPVLDVLENPGFELSSTDAGQIPGWTTSSQSGVVVGLDEIHRRVGDRSVRMASRGPMASLLSQPFDAPSTGRLTMSVWLRSRDATEPPPLRLVLEGDLEGRHFFRYALPQVGNDWGQFPFLVRVDDLPLEGLSRLRIRFDLMGPGEVWIDEVQLSHLEFSRAEKNALLKLIAPADVKLEKGQVRDCVHLLEGYWPRFLLAKVPIAEAPVPRKPEPSPPQPNKPQAAPSFFDRMKAFVPRKLPFF